MTSEPDVVASGPGVEEDILRAVVPGQLELVAAVEYIVDRHEPQAWPYTGRAEHPDRPAFRLADVQ